MGFRVDGVYVRIATRAPVATFHTVTDSSVPVTAIVSSAVSVGGSGGARWWRTLDQEEVGGGGVDYTHSMRWIIGGIGFQHLWQCLLDEEGVQEDGKTDAMSRGKK